MRSDLLTGCLPEISANGDFYTSSDVEVIIQSIWIILVTAPNDRPWAPEFGCNIFKYVFAIQDTQTKDQMQESVKSALEMWEPRIELSTVEVNFLPNSFATLTISFKYNNRDYTHVFYIGEYIDAQEISVYKLKASKTVKYFAAS